MSFLDIDRSLIGKEYDSATYGPVTAAELVAYARSLGESDPIYLDESAAATGPYGGLVAHPSFVVRLRGEKLAPGEVVRQMRRLGFDAGKDIEFGEPIRPGDRITISSSIHDIYEKTGRSGPMYFIVFRTALTNQRGEMVATVDSRMMQKGDAPRR